MSAAPTSTAAADAVATEPRGRNRIAARALNRVVAAVTADALDVNASRVGVDIADERGLLVLTVSTPIRIVSLNRVQAGSDVVARTGGSVVDRAAAAQETIRDRVRDLTGSAVARVVVRLTAADIREEDRVR